MCSTPGAGAVELNSLVGISADGASASNILIPNVMLQGGGTTIIIFIGSPLF